LEDTNYPTSIKEDRRKINRFFLLFTGRFFIVRTILVVFGFGFLLVHPPADEKYDGNTYGDGKTPTNRPSAEKQNRTPLQSVRMDAVRVCPGRSFTHATRVSNSARKSSMLPIAQKDTARMLYIPVVFPWTI
jgi:hypothetical protein